MAIIIYFDGSCINNPMGAIGYGCTVRGAIPIEGKPSKHIKHNYSQFGGDDAHQNNSNNVAEYRGLYMALSYLKDQNINCTSVLVYGDSDMVIRQMTNQWRIKEGRYYEDAVKTKKLLRYLKDEQKLNFTFKWIPRDMNTEADELSNRFYSIAIT